MLLNTDLHVALGDIERRDTGMGDTTCQDTSEHAFGVVRSVVGHGCQMGHGSVVEEKRMKVAE